MVITAGRGSGAFLGLRIATHTWSNIVTGLPSSMDNSMVLTVVDNFSKVAHLISLPKLPSAKKKTAQVVVDHVFKIHNFQKMWSLIVFPPISPLPSFFPPFFSATAILTS